ncbi:Leucine-rich repeat receptor-like serine threonine tyrosine-protein kinase [Ranunculus cassubicifolius]
MDFLPIKISLFLISLFSLILLVQPAAFLADSDALFLFATHMSLNQSSYHCNSVEVICEARSPVLRVTQIVLDSKQLKGTLSPTIGRFTELKKLSLSNNNLVGEIPSEIANCKNLEVLDLRSNQFSGQIPPDISSLVSLTTLDLSCNRFSGNLNFLKYFPNLEYLHLSNNLFSGQIPASMQNFRNLRFLNVSGNTGIQSSVPEISLPKRKLLAENYTRNNGSDIAPSPTPLTAPTKHKKKGITVKGWSTGFAVGISTGIFAGFISTVLFKFVLPCFKRRDDKLGVEIFSPLIKKAEDLAFLGEEKGLDSSQVIGRGGSGQVYKKELYACDGDSSTPMIVAIKKIVHRAASLEELNETETKVLNRNMRQVRAEIKTIGRIRHRNLVPLLAHVPRLDCHFLVYEFMAKGSLHDWLRKDSDGDEELDWNARYKIALGVAKGIEYLHIHHKPQILHRDLKPANILLDDDMEGRIADFGLAAVIPNDNTHLTASSAAGTVGFIAPEYYQSLKFTDKCDVYSFGVVLAILVTGKFPSNEIFQNTDEYLVKWLRSAMLSDNPGRIIDSKLIGNGFEEEMLLVMKIAWFCTFHDPKQRPNSKDIRIMLDQVKHQA